MKRTEIIMDMPVCVEITDPEVSRTDFNAIFAYFRYIDAKFSTFISDSEISLYNRGLIRQENLSPDMKTVLALAEKARQETEGYFDIKRNGVFDPSGIVKGWAVDNAAKLLRAKGFKNFYVDAGGDIRLAGKNSRGKNWTVGIRNPFNRFENIKILSLTGKGVATSGTYIRGRHIYDPVKGSGRIESILSLTVIAPDVATADSYATAAFAMGKSGINFIENLADCEGYLVDKDGMAVFTSKFNNYVLQPI